MYIKAILATVTIRNVWRPVMRFCMFIFNDCLSLVFCLTTILTLFLFNRRPQGQESYAPGVFTEILQLQIGL